MSSSPLSPTPLPMRWVLIFVAAAVVALLVGMLTFVQTVSWPAALLAALGSAGAAIRVLHQVLGK
ncbi:hypothetical protein [Dactylosporangium sp. NPDC048998]|uniref:hypothetical protein n=1 Tax=Dactylosporangium sp. NPDC048998 TaxID=3363976 RepID=UPI00372134BA